MLFCTHEEHFLPSSYSSFLSVQTKFFCSPSSPLLPKKAKHKERRKEFGGRRRKASRISEERFFSIVSFCHQRCPKIRPKIFVFLMLQLKSRASSRYLKTQMWPKKRRKVFLRWKSAIYKYANIGKKLYRYAMPVYPYYEVIHYTKTLALLSIRSVIVITKQLS